jgi:hypothetical protein
MSYGHSRFGSRATRASSKLGGVHPIDGQRLQELLGNTNNKKDNDMLTEHPGIAWARQQIAAEEAERRARAVPPPSPDEVLAERFLHGVRRETASSVIREARAFLDAHPGMGSRDSMAAAGGLLSRLHYKYDGTLGGLLAAGRGVEDLRRLLVGMLEAEGR